MSIDNVEKVETVSETSCSCSSSMLSTSVKRRGVSSFFILLARRMSNCIIVISGLVRGSGEERDILLQLLFSYRAWRDVDAPNTMKRVSILLRAYYSSH